MRWAFFAGLGFGTALGFLYAPKSGAETRGNLRNAATGSGKARQQISLIVDRAKAETDEAREANQSEASREEQQTVRAPVSILTIVNEWPHERLIEIDGIGPVLASKIISKRPYKAFQDLVASKLLPPSAITALRKAS
ncbi:MAG TPA: YtxH domain-containing protein [Clostridia bacterium]|nr:YtxH domain-containing protein [Clostridia bacterium]